MEREEVFNKLKELLFIMDERYQKIGDKITDDTSLVSDLGFASVTFLYMLIAVEESFQISFEEGVEFKTVGEVVDYIMGKL